MALATIEDLAMLGAVNPSQSDYPSRGDRLLENVTGQVCSFLQMTETEIVTAITDDEAIDLAGFVAEIAARRLQAPAAPTTDPMIGLAEIKNPDVVPTGGIGTIHLIASEYIGGPFEGDSLEDSWT
jgi:hypothetical protein